MLNIYQHPAVICKVNVTRYGSPIELFLIKLLAGSLGKSLYIYIHSSPPTLQPHLLLSFSPFSDSRVPQCSALFETNIPEVLSEQNNQQTVIPQLFNSAESGTIAVTTLDSFHTCLAPVSVLHRQTHLMSSLILSLDRGKCHIIESLYPISNLTKPLLSEQCFPWKSICL